MTNDKAAASFMDAATAHTREEWLNYLAEIGAKLRLVELEAERMEILELFPELRNESQDRPQIV